MTHRYLIQAYGTSDVGRVRANNEDSFFIADLSAGVRIEKNGDLSFPAGPGGSLFAVADGMGGAAAGEMASRLGLRIVYKVVQESIREINHPDNEELEEILIDAVATANRRIFQMGRDYEEYRAWAPP